MTLGHLYLTFNLIGLAIYPLRSIENQINVTELKSKIPFAVSDHLDHYTPLWLKSDALFTKSRTIAEGWLRDVMGSGLGNELVMGDPMSHDHQQVGSEDGVSRNLWH